MSEKIEGTIFLEGLIEGKLAGTEDERQILRDWLGITASVGLHFNMDIDGGSLSLLAERNVLRVADLGPEPSEKIADVLHQLLAALGPAYHDKLLSTVRSVEYRPGEEVQAIYSFTGDGGVDVRQRNVPAETRAPAKPLTPREKLRIALAGLLIALAVFGISSFFVPYGRLFRAVCNAARPLRLDELAVDASAFHDYFTVTDKQFVRGGEVLELTLEPTAAYAAGDVYDVPPDTDPGAACRRRLALDAMVRGYLHCEYFDEKGEFITYSTVRVKGLAREPKAVVALPMPHRRRPAGIVLTY